jgi:hypothetical protein
MSSRACPHCQCARVRHYSSLRYRQCDECLKTWAWDLKEGQSPLVGPARKMERAHDQPK